MVTPEKISLEVNILCKELILGAVFYAEFLRVFYFSIKLQGNLSLSYKG